MNKSDKSTTAERSDAVSTPLKITPSILIALAAERGITLDPCLLKDYPRGTEALPGGEFRRSPRCGKAPVLGEPAEIPRCEASAIREKSSKIPRHPKAPVWQESRPVDRHFAHEPRTTVTVNSLPALRAPDSLT